MRKLIVLLGCVVLTAAYTASVQAITVVVQPTGEQDAEMSANIGHHDNAAPQMRWGVWNDGPTESVAIHSLGGAIGQGLTAGTLISATLRVPAPDIAWTTAAVNNPPELALNVFAEHIDANSDTETSMADATVNSAALSIIGLYHAGGSPVCHDVVGDYSCVESYDVTSHVLDDLTNGRLSHAIRITPGSPQNVTLSGAHQHLFASVTGAGSHGDPPGGNAMVGTELTLEFTPEPATAGLMMLGMTAVLARRRRRIGA